MAKSKLTEASTDGTAIVTLDREPDLRDSIASKLFIEMAPQAEAKGKTIDSVADRAFQMAETFLRVRAARAAASTE